MDMPGLLEPLQRKAAQQQHRRSVMAGPLLAAAWLASGLAPQLAQAQTAVLSRAAARPEMAAPALAADTAQLASEQIRRLEQQVQAALTQARLQQEQMAAVNQRLAAAEASNDWLPWLLVTLVAMGLLALWQAWRLRVLQAERAVDIDWPMATASAVERLNEAAAPPPPDVDATWPPMRRLSSPDKAATPKTEDRAPQGLDSPTRPTPRLHEFTTTTGVPQRPVSVEELLDLEQQVDFFLALGQRQSAIDLLLGHVRETGGSSALPYLKLLEIYREQSDDQAYERTRERFNQRFNVLVPQQPADLGLGKSLEDYPEVLQRLQRSWSLPQRAAAELQSMLLHQEGAAAFELPAYRELLLLQALLLDLAQEPASAQMRPSAAPALDVAQAEARTDAVDLLLPLGEGPSEITSPRPHMSQRTSAQAMLAEWVFTRGSTPLAQRERPQAARQFSAQDAPPAYEPSMPAMLDLDLSDSAPAPRDFTEPAAFTDLDLRRDSRLTDLGEPASSDVLPSRR